MTRWTAGGTLRSGGGIIGGRVTSRPQYCYDLKRELHTHQLLVAERQVGDLPPAHLHHVKAAVRLPAEHPQGVCGAAEQAAAIRTEADTPGTHAHTHTGLRDETAEH